MSLGSLATEELRPPGDGVQSHRRPRDAEGHLRGRAIDAAADGELLGPDGRLVVSPELVLVDPKLAEIARALLPERAPALAQPLDVTAREPSQETPATGRPAAPRSEEAARPDFRGPLPEPRSRRRRVRLLAWPAALAAAFIAGVLAPNLPSGIHDVWLDVRAADNGESGRSHPSARASAPSPPKRTRAGQLRPLTAYDARDQRFRREAAERREPEPPGAPASTGPTGPPRPLPENVLGLVVQSTGRGVLVTWSRPNVSDHVRIVRFPGLSGSRFAVVYDGRRASYLDRRVEDGGVYRYVIRNYDAHGRASTGVTAVVVAERL